MNKNILPLGLGIAIGTGMSLIFLKKKYDAIVDKEISDFRRARKDMKDSSILDMNKDCPIEIVSIKDSHTYEKDKVVLTITYKNLSGDIIDRDVELDDIKGDTEDSYEPPTKEERTEYAKVVDSLRYDREYMKEDNTKLYSETSVKPYIITPDEFGSVQGADSDSFYCYEDGIITDCDNNVVDDVSETIGFNGDYILQQFGVNDPNAVYIRNPKLNMDIEILREIGTFEG